MVAASCEDLASPSLVGVNADLVELTVFLSRAQAADLEALAHQQGLTVGQLLRLVIRDFTHHGPGKLPGPLNRLEELSRPHAGR